jgi:hypothetical protein
LFFAVFLFLSLDRTVLNFLKEVGFSSKEIHPCRDSSYLTDYSWVSRQCLRLRLSGNHRNSPRCSQRPPWKHW